MKKTINTLIILVMFLSFAISVQAADRKIVTFGEYVAWTEIDAYIEDWSLSGVTVEMRLPLIHGVALNVPEGITKEDLAADPIVSYVEDDQKVVQDKDEMAAMGGFLTPVSVGRRELAWNIMKFQSRDYDEGAFFGDYKNNDGNLSIATSMTSAAVAFDKIKVAVFDTGINMNHTSLSSAVKGGLSVVGSTSVNVLNPDVPMDDHGHGSHVAGIITSVLDNAGTWGENAPVEVYGVKVLDHNAMGELSNIILGLQWAVLNDIDIVNMSIGFRNDSPAVRRAVSEASKAGLIMVASVGNYSNWHDDILASAEGGAAEGGAAEGGAYAGYNPEPLPMYSVMYPARYPEVIAVAASDWYGDSAWFNNEGPEVDIYAPGVDIVSADVKNGSEAFGYCSGTSMAAPHVAAAAAIMKHLAPGLGTAEIIALLKENALKNNLAAGELNTKQLIDTVTYDALTAWLTPDTKEEEHSDDLKKKIVKNDDDDDNDDDYDDDDDSSSNNKLSGDDNQTVNDPVQEEVVVEDTILEETLPTKKSLRREIRASDYDKREKRKLLRTLNRLGVEGFLAKMNW